MQKWDAMLQSLDVLDEQVKAYPVTHVGTFLSTYGVPGEQAWRQGSCVAPYMQQHDVNWRMWRCGYMCGLQMHVTHDHRLGLAAATPAVVQDTCTCIPICLAEILQSAARCMAHQNVHSTATGRWSTHQHSRNSANAAKPAPCPHRLQYSRHKNRQHLPFSSHLDDRCLLLSCTTAGMSWLFNDRQFLCRGVGVAFPDGTRALAVYSPPDGTYSGDPGVTKSRTIRAHMGVSGYVVSPYAGEERNYLGKDRCQITMVLQVDPRVSLLAA